MADINMDNVNIEIQSSSDKATSGVDKLIQTLNNLNSALSGSQNNINRYIQNMKEIGNVSKNIKAPQISTKGANENLSKELAFLNSNAPKVDLPSPKNNGFKQTGKETDSLKSKFQSLGSTADRIGNRIAKMFMSVGKSKMARIGIKALDMSFGGLGSKLSNIKDKVSSVLKSFSKYALALYGIRSAFYAVRNVTNEFLSSQDKMAQQLSANISYLKFSLGSMLAPVINYLTNLMFKLLQIIQYIVYYFARINIFAGRSAKSYASMGKSASKAAKETQKQLQAFDELNNINLDKNNGSGGGGGAGGITPDIDLSKVKEFSGPILDAIKLGDWYGVGMEIGRKINEALDKINWNVIQTKVQKIATNIADLLNGLVDGIDWTDLGKTIGEGINTAIIFADSFYSRANFENLGKGIGRGINGIFNTVDWAGLGRMVTNRLNAIIDTLYGIFSTIDFKKIGKSFTTALNSAIANIHWDNLGKVLSDGIKGILDFVAEFIGNLDWQKIAQAIEELLSNIDWVGIMRSIGNLLGMAAASLVNLGQVIGNYIAQAFVGITQFFSKEVEDAGGDIIKGIQKGILKLALGFGKWIWDNLYVPFIDGFKKAFKIQSPSKVMEELGVYIIQGLLNGISSLVGTVTIIAQNIWNNFTTTLSGIANWVNTTIVQPTINFLNNLYISALQIGKNIYNGFTGAISSISNFVNTRVVQPAINAFSNLWNRLSGIFNNIRSAIVNTLSNINIRIKMPHFSWSTQPANGAIAKILSALSLPTSLPKLSVSWYAQGGFPTEGDLFFANEAGPEMVGSIGNKNAVANNDQITKAIAEATYQAISQALNENQDNGQPIIVNVGSETLYKGIARSRSQASNQYGITV